MIQNELRGKKAVPFLEYCYKIKEEHTKEDLQGNTKAINNALFKIYEGMRFYSQPFSIEMLVNPIPYPNLTTINFDSEGKCTNPEYINWQQAEDKVIFEGWSMFQDGGIWKYYQPSEESNIMISAYDNKDLYFVVCEDEQAGSIKLNTVNDFITLCNLAGITLTFKK